VIVTPTYIQPEPQHEEPDYVDKSPIYETEENSFLGVFPSMMDIFSVKGDITGAGSLKESSELSSCNQSTVSPIPARMNSSLTDDSHNCSIKTNDDEINSSQTSPSIMNIFSMIDDTNKSWNIHDQENKKKLERESMGLPSMNVFSMKNDTINRNQRRGETPNGLSRFHPFVTNAFSINEMTMEEVGLSNGNQEIENLSFLSSMLDVEKSIIPERIVSQELKQRPPSDAGGSDKLTHRIVVTRAYKVKEHYLESIFYVSISAILGSIFRVYMARIFGFDCDYKGVDDFLTAFTSNICVTNGGQSIRTGGALFIDFPSNVFGSFLMGVITPTSSRQRARLPWLHRDHPLQRDEVFHASLGTGLCGCLTSFASWNTQMVVMLDGKYCELGSQVVTVFFGYLIGLMGAIYGFQFGRQCGLWMHNFRHRNEEDVYKSPVEESQNELHIGQQHSTQQGVELVDDANVKLKPVPSHLHKVPLLLTALGLLVAFIIGYIENGIEFYRGMTLVWILSPVGSLLRWKLSNLNITKEGGVITNAPYWLPWGTFGANMLATVVAACIEGLDNRYFFGADSTSKNKWVIAILFALKTGVAGSLSTVSTMIKECVYLSEKHAGLAKAHYYSFLTCACGCVLGLVVYASTIRINT